MSKTPQTHPSAVTARVKHIKPFEKTSGKLGRRRLQSREATSSNHVFQPPKSEADQYYDRAVFFTQVDPRAAERKQLLSTFLSSYFPSSAESELYLARHMSPLLVLPNIDLTSPMISSAVDTLCLAHLGSSNKDQKLVRASQDAYGRVIHSMMRAVGGGSSTAVSPREVIASCMMMSVYDDGVPGHFRSQNYATHLFGAARYAESHGPSCLDPRQPFDRKLLMWLRFQSFFVCTARRKTFFWDAPGWEKINDLFELGGSRDWFPLLVPLPRILETSDLYLAERISSRRLQEVFQVCRQLDDFRETQLVWIENDFAGQPGTAAVTDLESFDMDIEEHCFMTTSSTFTTFHIFKDLAHAMRCVVSWFLSIVSDCTLLRLLRAYPQGQTAIGQAGREVEQKAFYAASDICRSVYYYSKLNSLAYADLLCVWLDLTRTFFEEFGAIKEAGWSQACLIATRMRIERVRPFRRGTLCRIGDLFGTFERACRYRTIPSFTYRATMTEMPSTDSETAQARITTEVPTVLSPGSVVSSLSSDSSITLPRGSAVPVDQYRCPMGFSE